MSPRREPRASPSIAGSADHHDFRPLAPNRRDLLRGGPEWLPAIRTNRPLSVFVDQEHTLLWPSIPRLRRMVFRAAQAPVAAAPHVLARSPHACLRLRRARLATVLPWKERYRHISLADSLPASPAPLARKASKPMRKQSQWFHQLYRCQVNVSPRRSCRRIIAKLKVIVSGRSQPSDLVWAANERRSVRQSTGAGLPIGVLSL